MKNTQRMIWLDCLRLMAGISMLGLHSTADASGQPWVAYETGERVMPIVIRTFLYMARTELFVVISCFLLLFALEKRPRSYGETIKEQSRRLLIPFLFWTVFFAGYGLIKANAFGYFDGALAKLSNPFEWVDYVLLGSVKYHMHFLPTLFGIVLFYPLFRLSVKYPALGASMVVCLVMKHELDAFVFKTFWGTDVLSYLVRGVKILTYVGYGMMAGAALGIWQRTDSQTLQRWFAPIMYLGVMLFLFKGIAAWQTIQTGEWIFNYTPVYWADFLFPVVLFGGCMAVGHRKWPEAIAKMAPYSFGIYLCHPIFLDLCEIVLRDTELSPTAQVSWKITVTLLTTSLLVYGLSKVRILAWTIGLGALPKMRRPLFMTQKEIS